ncbi:MULTISPECIES: hypothetical protein [unclassified Streptomyces]|uniref:hypothetical protein n=1 Tax=unclassified Streptomyces TaxID=2593676 RepID=UPI0037AA2A64
MAALVPEAALAAVAALVPNPALTVAADRVPELALTAVAALDPEPALTAVAALVPNPALTVAADRVPELALTAVAALDAEPALAVVMGPAVAGSWPGRMDPYGGTAAELPGSGAYGGVDGVVRSARCPVPSARCTGGTGWRRAGAAR